MNTKNEVKNEKMTLSAASQPDRSSPPHNNRPDSVVRPVSVKNEKMTLSAASQPDRSPPPRNNRPDSVVRPVSVKNKNKTLSAASQPDRSPPPSHNRPDSVEDLSVSKTKIPTFEELRTDGHVYVDKTPYFIKGHDPAKRAEEALRQIEKNNYAAPFADPICIGMAIDNEKRQITEYRVKNQE